MDFTTTPSKSILFRILRPMVTPTLVPVKTRRLILFHFSVFSNLVHCSDSTMLVGDDSVENNECY